MTWVFVLLGLAFLPAGLFLINLAFLPTPRHARSAKASTPLPAVSVLIPVRDEASTIGRSLRTVLAQQGVDFELLVLDDHSSDRTAEIVREFAAQDSRVRLLHGAVHRQVGLVPLLDVRDEQRDHRRRQQLHEFGERVAPRRRP